MKFLKERIHKDGIVKKGNVLKVDSFLNHQIDVTLLKKQRVSTLMAIFLLTDVLFRD